MSLSSSSSGFSVPGGRETIKQDAATISGFFPTAFSRFWLVLSRLGLAFLLFLSLGQHDEMGKEKKTILMFSMTTTTGSFLHFFFSIRLPPGRLGGWFLVWRRRKVRVHTHYGCNVGRFPLLHSFFRSGLSFFFSTFCAVVFVCLSLYLSLSVSASHLIIIIIIIIASSTLPRTAVGKTKRLLFFTLFLFFSFHLSEIPPLLVRKHKTHNG